MRILIVEDDPLLGDGLQVGLGQAGFTVDWVRDGQAAAAALASPESHPFAAVVLDLNLPLLSGQEVLARCRDAGNPVPVLVLTARDGVPDKLAVLDGGADDYLVKPFDLDEVAARLRALIRRSQGRAAPLLRHGNLSLDPAARRVEVAGQPVEVSAREFALLEALLVGAGRVLSRHQLEEAAYGWGETVDSNAVEVHIHHLRRKFGSELIRTVRGVGYTVARTADGGERP
ncbi:MAG TPA: response regulator [Azospira sp.]|nr:response regulator [Azospira sp.]